MAKRPTIALCMIVKNEEENLPVLFESIKDCFDEVHITDTGSTDKTIEIVKSHGFNLHHFDWVNDFAKARNYSFSHAKTDYVMWLDSDDSLLEAESFKQWRDHAMRFSDMWYATYDYASDETGNPLVSFVRERVIKREIPHEWKYFVHEGLIPTSPEKMNYQYATTWKVKHRRSVKDIEKDHGRNLKLFEAHKDNLDPRMKFYYGKELFENKQPMEAFKILMDASSEKDLALHDRLLAIQFACYAAVDCNQLERARVLAHQGLQLDPNRAEYHVIIADSYIKQNMLTEAVPFYAAAKHSIKGQMAGDKMAGPVFNYKPLYTTHPRINLARAYFHLGDFNAAKREALECQNLFKDNESAMVLAEVEKALEVTELKDGAEETQDIIITTPPVNAYQWDSHVYKEKAMGGSETAAIEIATWLRKKTNRPVKIFNDRKELFIDEDGVEYHPVAKMLEYTSQKKPYRHIAWRHNHKITKAPTYLWCHDLMTAGVEGHKNFDKILCLSEFHKNYVMGMQGVPEDKIIVTRNGLRPERFRDIDMVKKQPGKVMFPSSPDRGLVHAMAIMDEVIKEVPHAELHVFYGIERLDQYGLKDLRERLERMFAERPYVKYHGAVDQKTLAQHFMESEVWLYPADFIESYCITAIEALSARCFPIARDLGALPCTLKVATEKNMAEIVDREPTGKENQEFWAFKVIDALKQESWNRIDLSPEMFSWESVADEFIEFMEIECLKT